MFDKVTLLSVSDDVTGLTYIYNCNRNQSKKYIFNKCGGLKPVTNFD